MKIISLGAGVQSTTLLLMSLREEFERPDMAIFADTQYEREATYKHLNFLKSFCEDHNFKLEIVTAGNIKKDVLEGILGDKRFGSMPFFTRNSKTDKVGMLRRQCTREYKITPIYRKIRELGANSKNPFEMWIGISLDEATRMKKARRKYVKNRYPLIEKRMSRLDCVNWLKKEGFKIPPKSACIVCPFHDDSYWRELKEKDQNSWKEAVWFDKKIRSQPKVEDNVYLHRQGVPLDEVDLSTTEDRGQGVLFDAECEGMCGI